MERRQPKPAKPISEIRKIRKPIMEKKRRERINNCLLSLKDMLIDENAVQRQGPKPSKLEKADILEQTVTHMRDLQGRFRLGAAAAAPIPPSLADTYRAGYQRCLQVVRSFSGLAEGPAALPRLVLSLEQGLDGLQTLSSGLGVGVGAGAGAGAAYRPPSPHSLSSESPRSEPSQQDGWAGAAGGAGDMDTAHWSSAEGESSDSSAEESDVLDLTSRGADGRQSRQGGDGVWRPW